MPDSGLTKYTGYNSEVTVIIDPVNNPEDGSTTTEIGNSVSVPIRDGVKPESRRSAARIERAA